MLESFFFLLCNCTYVKVTLSSKNTSNLLAKNINKDEIFSNSLNTSIPLTYQFIHEPCLIVKILKS